MSITREQIDRLVSEITNGEGNCSEQSKALHELERIAGKRAEKVALGVPLKPEDVPEMDILSEPDVVR